MKNLVLIASLLFSVQFVYAQSDSTNVLKLYPTEAKDYVNVYVTFDKPTDFTLSMVSKVWTEAMEWKEYAKESYQKKIDITRLPEGEYRIYLEYNEETVMRKFTIKH